MKKNKKIFLPNKINLAIKAKRNSQNLGIDFKIRSKNIFNHLPANLYGLERARARLITELLLASLVSLFSFLLVILMHLKGNISSVFKKYNFFIDFYWFYFSFPLFIIFLAWLEYYRIEHLKYYDADTINKKGNANFYLRGSFWMCVFSFLFLIYSLIGMFLYFKK